MPKGKRINSTSKQIICNVYDYFENESKKRKGSVLPKLGRRHLKLLVITSELLNESLGRRENWKEQNLLHQRSDIKRAVYALLWMILIVMYCQRTVHDFVPRKNTPL